MATKCASRRKVAHLSPRIRLVHPLHLPLNLPRTSRRAHPASRRLTSSVPNCLPSKPQHRRPVLSSKTHPCPRPRPSNLEHPAIQAAMLSDPDYLARPQELCRPSSSKNLVPPAPLAPTHTSPASNALSGGLPFTMTCPTLLPRLAIPSKSSLTAFMAPRTWARPRTMLWTATVAMNGVSTPRLVF